MFIFGVKHNDHHRDVQAVIISELFILMGGENLKKVEKASAGNIVGIGGLDDILYNMGTISDREYCPSFAKASLEGSGLVKVAVEPKNLSQMSILIEGLRKLDKSDPSAEFYQNNKGEYIHFYRL